MLQVDWWTCLICRTANKTASKRMSGEGDPHRVHTWDFKKCANLEKASKPSAVKAPRQVQQQQQNYGFSLTFWKPIECQVVLENSSSSIHPKSFQMKWNEKWLLKTRVCRSKIRCKSSMTKTRNWEMWMRNFLSFCKNKVKREKNWNNFKLKLSPRSTRREATFFD